MYSSSHGYSHRITWFFFFPVSSLGRVIPLLFDFNFRYFNIFPMPFTHKEVSLLGLVAQRENSVAFNLCVGICNWEFPPHCLGFFVTFVFLQGQSGDSTGSADTHCISNKEPRAAIWVLWVALTNILQCTSHQRLLVSADLASALHCWDQTLFKLHCLFQGEKVTGQCSIHIYAAWTNRVFPYEHHL